MDHLLSLHVVFNLHDWVSRDQDWPILGSVVCTIIKQLPSTINNICRYLMTNWIACIRLSTFTRTDNIEGDSTNCKASRFVDEGIKNFCFHQRFLSLFLKVSCRHGESFSNYGHNDLHSSSVRLRFVWLRISTVFENKAECTATPVAYGQAGAVVEKVTWAFGQER